MIRRAWHLVRIALCVVMPTLILCVAGLELGLRAIGRVPAGNAQGPYEQHGRSYRLRPNQATVVRDPSCDYTICTDDAGARTSAPGPRRLGTEPCYAWLGDSITFAHGVDYADSFVAEFGKRAPVVNLAVDGHRFEDQDEVLADFLAKVTVRPKAVVVVFTSAFIYYFESTNDGLLVRDGNLFRQEGWLLPYLTVQFSNWSASYCFLRSGIRNVQSKLFPAPPGAILETLRVYDRRGEWGGDAIRQRFLARLDRLDQRIRSAGSQPIYVYMPTSVDLRAPEFLRAAGAEAQNYDLRLYHDLLQAHAEKAGIRLIDMQPVLQAEHAKGQRMALLQDPHYVAAINKVIGTFLADAILGKR